MIVWLFTFSQLSVIRSLTPCITIFSRPFLRYTGVPVGARSTAIRLNEGDNKDMVWVLASSECDNETIDEINKLGQVKLSRSVVNGKCLLT